MLQDSYNYYAKCALTIDGFKLGAKNDVPYDIPNLASNYLKALNTKDELKQSQYISALMVRYWYMIPLLYNGFKLFSDVSIEDIVDLLYDSIMRAFTYRGWLDNNQEISKDVKGAEKVINRCITTNRINLLKYYNRNKRQLFTSNTKSLDDQLLIDSLNSKNNNIPSLIDSIASDDISSEKSSLEVIDLFLKRGKIIESVFLDIILNQDMFTYNKTKAIYSFSKNSLFKYLKQLITNKDELDNYVKYFSNYYNVEDTEVINALLYLCINNIHSFRSRVSKTLESIKRNKELKNYLCL